MRLLHTMTLLLEEFYGVLPPYAILSHTWTHDEASFRDIISRELRAMRKQGWLKIEEACQLAARDGFSYIWIDTCCIDKSSSAELNEAINSMFAWFKNSGICYAYLDDVADISSDSLAQARWFTRGWTLIELIAPANVQFYNRDWKLIGSRLDLVDQISEITDIDPFVLAGGDLGQAKVARRMFWASRRRTTRIEDAAYCLMGLFDVHMLVLYGEGEKAFLRLQEEIFRTTNDQSIFAWQEDVDWWKLDLISGKGSTYPNYLDIREYLAPSPRLFNRCGAMFPPLGVKQREESEEDPEGDALWDSMSTTSTLVQSWADAPTNAALKHAITFLQDDPVLLPLFQAAMERPGVSIDRFRRTLAGVLRYLAIELAEEAKNKDEESSASFVRRYRLVIASAVTASVAERSLKPVELKQDGHPLRRELVDTVQGEEDEAIDEIPVDSDTEDEDEEVANVVEANLELLNANAFIRSSHAYQRMVRRLSDLAHPSFRSRAIEYVEKLLSTKTGDSADAEYWNTMRSRMLLVISELHYSQPDSLLIDSNDELSLIEKIQSSLESLTGEEWNWWPLSRPRRPLRPGESRLGWTCVSAFSPHLQALHFYRCNSYTGCLAIPTKDASRLRLTPIFFSLQLCRDNRWEAVPEKFAQRLISLARKFPLTNSSPLVTPPPPIWGHNQAASSSTGKDSAPGLSPNPPAGHTKTPGNPSNPVLPSGYHMGSHGSTLGTQARFIFLVANLGRCTLDELPSLHLDTPEFGSQLRSTYLRRKGLWRAWLSPYGFSHCDFAKVRL